MEGPDFIIAIVGEEAIEVQFEAIEIQFWNHLLQVGLAILEAVDEDGSDDVDHLLLIFSQGFEVIDVAVSDHVRDLWEGARSPNISTRQREAHPKPLMGSWALA